MVRFEKLKNKFGGDKMKKACANVFHLLKNKVNDDLECKLLNMLP